MKSFVGILMVCMIAAQSSAQVLPHRMRVGVSADVLGATLGIGVQLHGSLRITDDYRAFDDKHTYINVGVGIGGGFTGGAGIIGQTVPHYVTYGIGRGRAMVEFGYGGIWMESQTMETIVTSGGLSGIDKRNGCMRRLL